MLPSVNSGTTVLASVLIFWTCVF